MYRWEVHNYLHPVRRPIRLSKLLNLCSPNAYVEQESKERKFHKTNHRKKYFYLRRKLRAQIQEILNLNRLRHSRSTRGAFLSFLYNGQTIHIVLYSAFSAPTPSECQDRGNWSRGAGASGTTCMWPAYLTRSQVHWQHSTSLSNISASYILLFVSLLNLHCEQRCVLRPSAL